uniref:Ketimine reductase mu-crystallin n=1 Tax=Cacopsylla melanoneura TaxID=428564 RepID=A0A8D9F3M5_9HEMI
MSSSKDSSTSGVSQAPLFLSDNQVVDLLEWKTLVPAIESVMTGVVRGQVTQPARLVMRIPDKDAVVLSMPGYVKGDNSSLGGDHQDDSLAVKIVTSFTRNKDLGLPSILATVLLYNSDNGKLKVVMEGTEITKWRTAAASVVATKHVFPRSTDQGLIVAIMGSGAQAEIHARAFDANFNVKKINIWNHRYPGAQALAAKLSSQGFKSSVKACEHGQDAVNDADIIVTATYSPVPVVKYEWIVKRDVHINAVGSGMNHHSELDDGVYSHSSIFFDSEASARNELKGLYDQFPSNMIGEVGQLMDCKITASKDYHLTVFHSMGMASEDVITAKLVYDKYKKQNNKL